MKEQVPRNIIQIEDEILQVLFWMQGEGLGREVSLDKLVRFLRFPADAVLQATQALVSKGQLESVSRHPELVVTLSAAGYSEGGRRFHDEFESFLGHESHLVCDDPNCDCHAPDWDGACSHLGRVQ